MQQGRLALQTLARDGGFLGLAENAQVDGRFSLPLTQIGKVFKMGV